MKSHSQKTMVLSFIVAAALAMPAIAQTDQPKSETPSGSSSSSAVETPSTPSSPSTPSASMDTDQNKVSGKVTAKSDDSLTVDGQTIVVTRSSTLTKAGSPVKIGDLNVGDKVTVSTIKGADGKLLAVTVEVGG